ncbi:MAG: transposase, partial [Elainellaceae cyanobacterium]
LQQSIADLGVAFKNFFSALKGKRQGPKVKPPRFKRKDNRQSARFRIGGFSLKGDKVYLAKVGKLKVRWSRPLPSEPSSVTVIKDRAGRYFLSFVVEVQPVHIPAKNHSVGVDLGIKTFAVLSSGEQVRSAGYDRLNRKIRSAQRQLSRRVKGSKRRERVRLRIAKLKAKLRDIQKDFLHKLSTRLVRQNSVVCIEDLNLSGMVKNRKLARAISEQGWREFRTMCEAQAVMIESREVSVISRWEPTSQLCADCGDRWGRLDLSVRELACLGCGSTQDRDENASRNIEQSGLELARDSKRAWSGHKTSLGAIRAEASTHREVV